VGTSGRQGLLRDLSSEEFADRYGCDRFVASVLSARLSYIIQHMCTKLQANAFSPIIRDSTDFSATICGPEESGWAMPSVSQTLPLFYGAIPDAVRVTIQEVGPENLRPGDVLIVNDPYRVGTHLNDVTFIKPVFLGGRIVAVFAITAHQLDWGGKTKGGFDYTKTSLYVDGLVLPPTLLFRDGKPVKSTFSLIEANTRLVNLVLPDILTLGGCMEIGERLLTESITKYGMPAYLGAIRFSCDASAEGMRLALERVPDGVYEGEETIDGDSLPDSLEYVVRVRITKRGGRAEFDFSGTSHVTRTSLNCSWADAKTPVAMALKYLLDPRSPFTSGTMRDVDLVVPHGTILNPAPPAATMGYTQPVEGAMKAIFKALNPVLGHDAASPDSWGNVIHTAEGVDEEGRPWYAHATSGIGPTMPWGGTRHGDGDSRQRMQYVNMLESGIEPTEVVMPCVVLRRDAIPDGGGKGQNRGGTSSITDSYWLRSGDHNVFQFHSKRPTGGVNGASPGRLGGGWVFPPADSADAPVELLPSDAFGAMYGTARPLTGVLDTDTNELNPNGRYNSPGGAIHVTKGSVIRYISNGAGGWGDPLERAPEQVLRDVRNEYVSIEGAARDYGVVVRGDPVWDPEGLQLDLEGTQKLRASMRPAS
jgi:N-methylhydantoinase B